LQEQKGGKAVNTDKEEKKTKKIIEDSDLECSETFQVPENPGV